MKKNALVYITLSLFVLLALLVGPRPQRAPADAGLDVLTRQLDQRMPVLLSRYDVPGAAVALVHNGEVVWSQGYGVADEARNIPVRSETVFQAASISKAVTAWGVMRLVERGQLDLDAPADRYLTRWHLPPSQYDPGGVTIRRLLSHTAGISTHIPRGFDIGQPLPSLEDSLSGRAGSGAVQLSMQPGAQHSYTGGGYTLLQLIIEEVTGQPFASYMQQEVLNPLGMFHSGFEWRADLRPATAVGYARDGNAYPNVLRAEQAAAGLFTTAPDLARFMAAGMVGSNGEPPGRGVLSPASVDLMFTPIAQVRGLDALTTSAAGLGHFIEALPDGTILVSHAGTNWGWQLIFVSLPERGDGIVVLTNGTRGIALYAEVLSAWGNWLGIGAPRVARAYQSLRSGVLALAAALAAALLFAIKGLVRGLRSGRRQWLWRFSSKPGARAYISFAAATLLALLFAVAWYIVAHQLLDWMIGKLAYWSTAAVLAWCLYGLVSAFVRPAPVSTSP